MNAAPTFQKGRQHAFLRLPNRIGVMLDRWNIHLPLTNLDEDNLFQTAMRSTRLDDFGADYFREPFHVLLEAAKSEHLTWSGRVSARAALLGGLKRRLWTQETLRRNPDILEQPVRRPLIVVGAPRTGTTLLNHLLALDPAARPLLMWEAITPTPWRYRRDGKRDPRRALCAIFVRLSKKLIPELAIVHDFGCDVPDECTWLFWPTFVWPPTMVMPTYREWLIRQPDTLYEKVYREYRRTIQMLQWQRPARGHWVLKSPLHVLALPSLVKAVPEACVVQTHRNLREVIPSFCSLDSVLASIYTDAVEPKKIGPVAMELARDVVERIVQSREKIDASRLCDVNYAKLVADPVGTVCAIYAKFGHEFTPEFEKRLRRFLAEKEAAGRPRHVYSLEQFNLDGAAIDREFATYHRQFGLEH